MQRTSVSLLVLLLAVCASTQKDGIKRQVTKPQIYSLKVVSDISSRFASTLVTSKVANPTAKAQEVVFTMQLPSAAFISNFSMEIDGKVIVGDVKAKEEAKQQFEAAKSRGQSAGLVAQKRETNQFDISVNVAANNEVVFNLTYQEVLQRIQGVYKHIVNINPGQVVDEMRVDVFITESAEIDTVFVPEITEKAGEMTNSELLKGKQAQDVDIHKTVTKDASQVYISYAPSVKKQADSSKTGLAGQLVVLYDVKRDQSSGKVEVVNGYFVQFFAPDSLPTGNKRVVFVLDKSGSMLGQKMTQMKQAMQVILNDTKEGDTFNIITFSDGVQVWKPEPVPASRVNVQEAKAFVNAIEAVGSTNIHDAVIKGIDVLKNSSGTQSLADMIVFLTDGLPTVGVTGLDEIVQAITRKNPESVISIHSIGFGNDLDFDLLKKISAQNRGVARKIYVDSDAAIQLAGFYNEISSPLLTNLKIVYVNETVLPESLVQNTQYTYYDGSEIMVMGQLNPQAASSDSEGVQLQGEVTGTSQSGARRYPVDHFIPCYLRCPIPIGSPRDESVAIVRPPHPIPCGCPPHPRPIPVTTPRPLPAASVGGFIERMWAYQTIQNLLKKAKFEETEVAKQTALKDQALQLSLKYNFVTELTSMVVTQPGQNSTVAENTEVKPQDNMVANGQFASFSGGARARSNASFTDYYCMSGGGGARRTLTAGGGAAYKRREFRPKATFGAPGGAVPLSAHMAFPAPAMNGVPPSRRVGPAAPTYTEDAGVPETTLAVTTEAPKPCHKMSSKVSLFANASNYHNYHNATTTEQCFEQCYYSPLCTTALYEPQTMVCRLSMQEPVSCDEPATSDLPADAAIVLYCLGTGNSCTQ